MPGLQGTLTPNGVLTEMQAQIAMREQALRAQTEAAAQQAQQSQQQYQTAAAQPAPQLSAMDQFTPLLMAGIASVLQQSEAPKQRAYQSIDRQKSDLIQSRTQNLEALRRIYEEKARVAEESGRAADAEIARSKLETLTRTHTQLLEQMGQAGADNRERLGNRQAERNALISQGLNPDTMEPLPIGGGRVSSSMQFLLSGDHDTPIARLAEMVESGQTSLTSFQGPIRVAIADHIAANGGKILPPKVRDSIASVSAASGVLDELEKLSAHVNTGGPGVSRIVAGAKSLGKAVVQSDEEDAIFDSTAEGFLATLSRATGERGVLTDRDVFRARRLIPKRFDSKDVAADKIRKLRTFLDGVKERALRVYMTKDPQGNSKTTVEAEDAPADYEYDPQRGLVKAGGQ